MTATPELSFLANSRAVRNLDQRLQVLIAWALDLLDAEAVPALAEAARSGLAHGDLEMRDSDRAHSRVGLFHAGTDELFIEFLRHENDFVVSEHWGGFDN